jgi:hypothetical protein
VDDVRSGAAGDFESIHRPGEFYDCGARVARCARPA